MWLIEAFTASAFRNLELVTSVCLRIHWFPDIEELYFAYNALDSVFISFFPQKIIHCNTLFYPLFSPFFVLRMSLSMRFMKDATVTWMCNAPFKGDAWQEKKLAEIKWHSFLPSSLLLSHKHHSLSHNLTASHLSCYQVLTYMYFLYISHDKKRQPRTDMCWPLSNHQLNKQRTFAWAGWQPQPCLSFRPFPPTVLLLLVSEGWGGGHTNLQVCQPPSECWAGLPMAWFFCKCTLCKWGGLWSVRGFIDRVK